jgi:hypothetical protein
MVRAVRRVVLAAGLTPGGPASPELVAAVASGDLAWLPRAAVFHGVAPALHLALARVPDTPERVRHALERSFHGTVSDHLRTLEDVALLEAVLGRAGVPWLVLKGPVLGETYYERPDVRPYSDLDVLVGPDAFGDAVAALEAAGCRVAQEWSSVAGDPPGETQLTLPSGRSLDLHWHLVNSPRVRRRFAVDIRPLFDRSRRIALGRVQVLTLGPADTLAHLLLHGCLSGGDRLIWLKDVALCVQQEGPEVLDEAKTVADGWGAGLVADVYLQRVSMIYGDAAPQELAAAQRRRSPWLSALRIVDRRRPVTGHDGGASAARVLARATRTDDLSSVLELVRKASLNLAGRLPAGGRGVGWHRSSSDWQSAEPRLAFLRAVDDELSAAARPPAASL